MQTNDSSNQVKPDEFRVGDTVWCLLNGEGQVISTKGHHRSDFKVEVQFKHTAEDETWCYTKDGKMNEGQNRTLFFSEPKVEASVTRPFVPTLVGKMVLLCPIFGDACSGVISEETTNTVVHKGITWNKSSIVSIYEISKENLLQP